MVQGRIKRLRSLTFAQEKQATVEELSTCALCDRSIPPALRDAHHLIPKSKGGVTTVMLHRACHKQIHALFTETELAKLYPTAQALKAHPEMERFINWVKQKPNDMNPPIRRSKKKGATNKRLAIDILK